MPQEHRLPPFVEPQLATLADAVPTAAGWIYELKFDGYRTLVRADGKTVRCFTRTGLDWTDRYGAVPRAIAALPLGSAVAFVVVSAVAKVHSSGAHQLEEYPQQPASTPSSRPRHRRGRS